MGNCGPGSVGKNLWILQWSAVSEMCKVTSPPKYSVNSEAQTPQSLGLLGLFQSASLTLSQG